MSKVLRISEAASLALHAMALLAARPGERWGTRRIADYLRASTFHLSKVLQRLAHVGLLTSVRGPKGGFMLARPAETITLLEVYEAIEGPLTASECLLDEPVCRFRRCILGGLVGQLNRRIKDYLAHRRLSQLRDACREGD